MRSKFTALLLLLFLGSGFFHLQAQNRVLIPMDGSQTNHLKAYGIIFNHLNEGETGQWLLNYRGGSFLTTETQDIIRKSRIRNVKVEVITESQAAQIIGEVENPGVNMSAVNLEAAPKIAVYSPPGSLPWDDAVTLVLDYAEIPYDTVYDRQVLSGELADYDWLHLHHEDFTGQFGKFWGMYQNAPWYITQVQDKQELATELGYEKVSQLKLDIVHEIRDFVGNGGFMFAMCSATDTFDISLAAEGLDIIPREIDGDPIDNDVNNRLNFNETFAFEGFEVITDPYEYEHSTIDIEVDLNRISESLDFFTLFDFSAKWDPVPSMLTQNHVSSIRGFYGQATAFQRDKIKNSAVILAESPGRDQVKYVHGNYGNGTFTFYGGHDPEDYTHRVGDPPTDLSLHTNSPGYRLILNNILFPAAEKKKKQT
ncbi:asparagine synthetase B [Rhodohalobacter barkolensis]|uniref:Asparagine synthetase B n=1 Tax=Rhodohalobacter barkolensis TaxID=2053187 RepID=A0A2N0VJP7_9BACT|nr:asparagine synthetase B [Rhodohalobacter barkolensis]PKD44374.1 asparagine synthetase B [Rhodohalobacter barkolensis]